MKPFPDLTDAGKVRRLRALALEVLPAYPIDVDGISLVDRRSNTMFRVETADGTPFALRVGPPVQRRPLHLGTELAWLVRLADDALISAPVPVPNELGKLFTLGERPDVLGARECVLFEWIPGRPIGDEARPVDYAHLGETAAQLHSNAAKWRRRRNIQPLVWDRAFYYPDEEAVLYDGRFRSLITPERRRVVQKVQRRVESELQRIQDELPVHLLHGDLHPWNAHLHGGRMHIIDFEEVMMGAPVQDIAITLWHASRRSDYEELLAAFVEGYRTVREWPVEYAGQVNLLMAGRSLMVLNYAFRRGLATEEFVADTVEDMAGVL